MRKVVQYVMVGGNSNWENEVNRLIDEGWQPYGGPVSTGGADAGYLSLFQAMVIYEEEGKIHAR